MIEISRIIDVPKYLDEVDVVIFDLDDTLYSEKEYVRSGYNAVCPEKSNELWNAFCNNQKAFDVVFPEKKDDLLEKYRNHFPNIHLYPGILEMLVEIRNKDKKLALITDGRPYGQKQKIKALGIENLFDEIIITDELGGVEYRKPCRKAFELMHERFATDYSRMIYIGDNINKDFVAPIDLGMKYVYFNNNDGIYKKRKYE